MKGMTMDIFECDLNLAISTALDACSDTWLLQFYTPQEKKRFDAHPELIPKEDKAAIATMTAATIQGILANHQGGVLYPCNNDDCKLPVDRCPGCDTLTLNKKSRKSQ